MKRRPQRGFALIIVAICGVAMTAIALAVVFTAGSQRILSVKGASIDHATAIADSGMERALAYAQQVAAVEMDFDKLLEPGLPSRDCLADATLRAVGTPRYSDGTTVTDAGGTRYSKVVVLDAGGEAVGAYYTRFDDDGDDITTPSADLSTFTGNNPNGTTCLEGTAFTAGNNPHRDRNRSVWITVVGVYPAQDLATAKNRITLRRLYTSPEVTPTPSFFVNGSVTLSNTATLEFCSDQGTMGITGSLTSTGTLEHWGSIAVSGAVSATGVDPGGSCPVAGTRGAISAGAAVQAPISPSPVHSGWLDASSKCIFRMDTRGLFYWDGTGSRAGGATLCQNLNPLQTPSPTNLAATPPIDLADANPGTCWLPLLLLNAGTVSAGIDTDEVCGSSWCPKSGDVTAGVGVAALPFAGPAGWAGRYFSAAPPKPDFALCAGHGPEFKPTEAFRTCAGSCDGTNAVVGFTGGEWVFTDNYAAYPAGVYIVAGAGKVLTSPTATPATAAATDWPHITIVSTGPITMGTTDYGVVGVGTTPPVASNPTRGQFMYPSLIVAGPLTLSQTAELHVGGSLYVNGPVTLSNSSSLTVRGQFASTGLTMSNSSTFTVIHDVDFGDPVQEQILAPPTNSKTLR